MRKNPLGSSRRELKVLFGAGVGDVDVRYVCVPVVVPKAGGHFDADWRDRPRSLSQEGPRPRVRCPASSPTNRPTRSGATPPARLFQRVFRRAPGLARAVGTGSSDLRPCTCAHSGTPARAPAMAAGRPEQRRGRTAEMTKVGVDTSRAYPNTFHFRQTRSVRKERLLRTFGTAILQINYSGLLIRKIRALIGALRANGGPPPPVSWVPSSRTPF